MLLRLLLVGLQPAAYASVVRLPRPPSLESRLPRAATTRRVVAMASELRLVSATPHETRKIATIVAGALRRGDVVALTGELGAGKTCFVQGAAEALGVTDRVTSPSFLLRREYNGHVPVLHLDVYRLETLQQVIDLGYEEALDRSHVTFIEWGDAMSPLLPREHLELEFRLGEGVGGWGSGGEGVGGADAAFEERHIIVRPRGEDWLRRMTGLSADLQRFRRRQPASDPEGGTR
jgi:tRNA threonylcarbamoyladenosine biosynthesis protein TsaE